MPPSGWRFTATAWRELLASVPSGKARRLGLLSEPPTLWDLPVEVVALGDPEAPGEPRWVLLLDCPF